MCHNEHQLTANCVGHTFFGGGELGCFHSYDWHFKFGSYEWAHILSIATIRPRKSSPSLSYGSNKACATAQRCHCCISEISWGIQCAASLRFLECRTEYEAQFCDILRLLLLTHAQSIGNQHPTGKQGIELCCSPRGVVLYGGYSERHPCLPGKSCHCAIWQSCITICFMQCLKTFLCTMTSCHFNFDPGTLL